MSTTPSDVLRKTYGDDIILFDEQNESTVYHLLKEFVYGNQTYAVMQSDELKKEDEVAVFRVDARCRRCNTNWKPLRMTRNGKPFQSSTTRWFSLNRMTCKKHITERSTSARFCCAYG